MCPYMAGAWPLTTWVAQGRYYAVLYILHIILCIHIDIYIVCVCVNGKIAHLNVTRSPSGNKAFTYFLW